MLFFHSMKQIFCILVFIFFISLFPCIVTAESFSVKNDTGLLWTDSAGTASYLSFGLKGGDSSFFLAYDGGAVFSDHSFMDVTLPFFRLQSGYRGDSFGITLSGGFVSYEELHSSIGDYQFSSDGAGGGYVFAESFFSIEKLAVKLSFFHASADWNNGDLYYLFGKPDISFITLPELSFEYDEKHRITARAFFLEGALLNNDEAQLGTLNIQAWNVEYGFLYERSDFSLDASFGWLYAGAEAEGALNPENQNYFAFPFRFLNAEGSGNLHIGYGFLTADIGKSLFHATISAGLFQLIHDDIRYSYQYRMKQFFGGEENALSEQVDLAKKPGFVFLNLDAGIRDLSLSKQNNASLSVGLRKVFIIPWNIDVFSGGGTSATDFNSDFITSILLSGLSFYIKVSV